MLHIRFLQWCSSYMSHKETPAETLILKGVQPIRTYVLTIFLQL